ncbi:hypothetical protein CLIB1423_13S03642 [[Candida] railenensis]|uniref:Uncharacterized protein n=1 Tax=[Candida] railenensis TaxID=45579 RepID=A0A9P0VZX6_9ASCO|nr:hypothetical protein CLIB1423_13S03642 [[Candida] railenensis]
MIATYQDSVAVSPTPISIPSHSIKTHLYDKRKNTRYDLYHPLDFVDSEESELEEEICESFEDDSSFPNSLGSLTSSSVGSISSVHTSIASSTSSLPGSSYLILNKKTSQSQISAINVTTTTPILKTAKSSANFAKILESNNVVLEAQNVDNSNNVVQKMSKSGTAFASYSKSILQTYLKIDLLPDFFGRGNSHLQSSQGENSNGTETASESVSESETSETHEEEELQSFSSNAPNTPFNPSHYKSKPIRNRELRINSRFLIMYTFDFNSRVNGLLPSSNTAGEFQELLSVPAIKRFHKKHNLNKVSNLSRDKLWENVILQARNDSLPSEGINYENYIKEEEDDEEEDEEETSEGESIEDEKHFRMTRNHSIIKLNGSEYLPWANLKSSYKCVKPAGILEKGKYLCNGESPCSGVTRTQFTVKGWCNKRWVSST